MSLSAFVIVIVNVIFIWFRLGNKGKVYAMIDQGFKEELEDGGISYIGFGPEKTKVIPKTMSTASIMEVCLHLGF